MPEIYFPQKDISSTVDAPASHFLGTHKRETDATLLCYYNAGAE